MNLYIDGAARDVQAAINAAPRADLNDPNYRKVNPADAPYLVWRSLPTPSTRRASYDAAALPDGKARSSWAALATGSPRRSESDGAEPHELDDVRAVRRQRQPPESFTTAWEISTTDQLLKAERSAADRRLSARRHGATVNMGPDVQDAVEDLRSWGLAEPRRW